MAILEMTREEFEKKYGYEPLISASPQESSTPEPVSISTQKSPTRNISQKIGGFLGIEKFGQGLGQAIFNITNKKQISELEKAVAEGNLPQEDLLDVTTGGLSNREVVGSAINTATMFAPGAAKGSSFGKKVLAGAATGYGFDVGSELQNEERTLKQVATPGLGTVIGGAIPTLGAIFGKSLSPKSLEQISLRMTPVEKQNLAKQGKDIAGFLAKKKIVGTPEVRYQKINQLYDAMENKVGNLVKESGIKYTKDDLIKSIQSIPDQFSDDITGYNEAVRSTEKIIKFIQSKSPKEISGELLNNYKRNLFKRAYSKNNTDVVNETYHAVAGLFKEKLDEAIPSLKTINQEYGNIITARKILHKAMGRPQLGLTGKILGTTAGIGIGASLGGGIGAAAGGVIGEKVAEKALGTATRSVAGAGLQTIDDIISKIPADKVGNLQISRKALIRLLQQLFPQ